MTVIAPDERADFLAILVRHRLDESDFLVQEGGQEGGVSDVVDDVYPLQGLVTITRRSTLKEREYRIGHGTDWTAAFEKDLNKGVFG
ncbi:hypothetical protein AWB78_04657 [Caballeronia calidae]|uniref:Uncharacterized protein n=1 Tax=Caballeronia calidae TaxID=1777139 RepID=A0A158D2W2_9BURK|nr:hypothetical protein [Caballeronia calidae]SAK88952.1 hypothetical protein AWB78_04657 [Caballeronia calidae]